MLHRMALRVLPSLSLAVTEHSVRKKKRIVMFVPGLVAFAVYRAAKLLLPLSEPIVLLAVSGLVWDPVVSVGLGAALARRV
jgi:lipopolysaccharide export LptBFGC system permease protein LptF